MKSEHMRSSDKPRVRFAPSPTGYLHVGGARTALFNWLFARHYGGKLLLRVEDTDKGRSTEASTKAIFDGLNWLGLSWDEPVVFQGANAARHQQNAHDLVRAGKAYPCFCTQDELNERRAALANPDMFRYDGRCSKRDPLEMAGAVIRFKVPEGVTKWNDLVHGTIEVDNATLDDFVILRSDGSPIYNLAVVSDDIDMRITTVLRGDDHISNTPKQILLYEALGAAVPQFGHLPMIHGADGKKLSKRHGATAVGDYQHLGILPEAMLNFLALLGWSPGNDIEVMSVDDMIRLFGVERLLKKAAVFDHKKLTWMNGQHLSKVDTAKLVALVQPQLPANDSIITEVVELLKAGRARTVDELVLQARPFFGTTIEYNAEAAAKSWSDKQQALAILTAAKELGVSNFDAGLREIAVVHSVKPKIAFQVVRMALVGSDTSPGMFDVVRLLGQQRTQARIADAITYLEA